MKEVGYKLYLVFLTSWFLHLTSRLSILGKIRFDLLLVLILTILIFLTIQENERIKNDTDKILKVIIIYVIATLPFVQWPGSVMHIGIPNLIKAIVFYYFTIYFVTTENKLKIFIGLFIACQSFRIIEPLYLHLTEGYWGSAAYAQGEFMDRLSGAPYDVVNPNGLAFIIDSIIPFSYFLAALSWKNKAFFLLTTPAFLYALILTGSRSGLLGLFAILMGCVFKSNKKLLLIAIIVVCSGAVFVNLTPEHQDRYLSIIDPSAKHAATARGRVEGIMSNFEVALLKPIFGHGLGTSREANYNFSGNSQLAHNLYAEIAQELGFVGLVVFIFFMKSICKNFFLSYKTLKINFKENIFLVKFTDAMQAWLGMNILFSFASFGLSSYLWYLFAGLSVVLIRLSSINHELQTSKNEG